jgi:hypothetical protein
MRTLSCVEQFRVMAFAQLTYRESLRDIEATSRFRSGKFESWVESWHDRGMRKPLIIMVQ